MWQIEILGEIMLCTCYTSSPPVSPEPCTRVSFFVLFFIIFWDCHLIFCLLILVSTVSYGLFPIDLLLVFQLNYFLFVLAVQQCCADESSPLVLLARTVHLFSHERDKCWMVKKGNKKWGLKCTTLNGTVIITVPKTLYGECRYMFLKSLYNADFVIWFHITVVIFCKSIFKFLFIL